MQLTVAVVVAYLYNYAKQYVKRPQILALVRSILISEKARLFTNKRKVRSRDMQISLWQSPVRRTVPRFPILVNTFHIQKEACNKLGRNNR